eukprot:COSAG02_NODE_857_length_16462_cov_4.801381_6_plen_51_part_00
MVNLVLRAIESTIHTNAEMVLVVPRGDSVARLSLPLVVNGQLATRFILLL